MRTKVPPVLTMLRARTPKNAGTASGPISDEPVWSGFASRVVELVARVDGMDCGLQPAAVNIKITSSNAISPVFFVRGTLLRNIGFPVGLGQDGNFAGLRQRVGRSRDHNGQGHFQRVRYLDGDAFG